MFSCMPVAALVLVAAPAAANVPVPPDAVAIVNGAPVSRAAYDAAYRQTKAQHESRFGTDFTSAEGKVIDLDVKREVLDRLVERQLMLNEAKKYRLTVPDVQIIKKLDEVKQGFPHETVFLRALKNNRMSLDDLKGSIRETLLIQALKVAMTSHVVVSSDEVEAYYAKNAATYKKPEEVKASHILIKDEKKAKEILAKLKAGGDFAALAKENSEDPGSGDQGGDLGYFGKGRMVPELEKSAFSLKPGQMSDLVKSQFGYHIIKVVDRQPARTQPLAEVQDAIRESITQERRGTEVAKWLRAAKANAIVTYSPDLEDIRRTRIRDRARAAIATPAPSLPVITVDGRSVTAEAFGRLFGAIQQSHLRYQQIDFDAPDGREAGQEAHRALVDQLVEWLVLEAGAAREGLVLSEREVDAEIDRWKAAEGEGEFQSRLDAQHLTLADIRWSARAAVLTEWTREHVAAGVVVPEADVEAHYQDFSADFDLPEQLRVRHVLVDSESQAWGLWHQLRRGASFEMLARHHSQDPSTRDVGGAFGFFARGSLLPEFEAAAFALRPGALSEPVKTDAGYHVIQAIAHRPARTRSFDDARAEVREALTQLRVAEAHSAWLLSVREAVSVRYAPGFSPAP